MTKNLNIILEITICLLLVSCTTSSISWDLSINNRPSGLTALEKIIGEKFIYIPESVALDQLSLVDTSLIYTLAGVEVDRDKPLSVTITFESSLQERKKFTIPIDRVRGQYSSDLQKKFVLGVVESSSFGPTYYVAALYDIMQVGYYWYNDYFGVVENTSTGFRRVSTLVGGFYPEQYFREICANVVRTQDQRQAALEAKQKEDAPAKLYQRDKYLFFEDTLSDWKNQMIVLTGELPNAGWVYGEAKAIYYMPLTKVKITQGHLPQTYILEFRSTDYGVVSSFGYTYYKRVLLRDRLSIIDIPELKQGKTLNARLFDGSLFSFRKPFLMTMSGWTTIVYDNGETQKIMVYETVSFHAADPNRP